MRKQLSKIIFILIISLFIHPLISYSQEGLELTEEQKKIIRAPLKGIKGIYVSIERLRPDAKELGITKESLKTKVELKLRLAGIKVYSREEWLNSYGAISNLYVNLNTIGLERVMGAYAFNISFSLQDMAYITRSSRPKVVITWSESRLGVYNTKKNGLEEINKGFKEVTDIFLNDYLAVNPKK